MRKFEGYIRPVMQQVQWCLGMLTLVNTVFLVFGTPTWIDLFYVGYGVMTIAWLVYYFKRGRRQEFENVVRDNPIYDVVCENQRLIKKLDEQSSSNNSKQKPRSVHRQSD